MTSPPTILLGEVTKEVVFNSREGSTGIVFEKPLELLKPETKCGAILVVLEPDQNPREVAETILWALRSHPQPTPSSVTRKMHEPSRITKLHAICAF